MGDHSPAGGLSNQWWQHQLDLRAGRRGTSGTEIETVRVGGAVVGFIGCYQGAWAAIAADGRRFGRGPIPAILEIELCQAAGDTTRWHPSTWPAAHEATSDPHSAGRSDEFAGSWPGDRPVPWAAWAPGTPPDGPTLHAMAASTTIQVRARCEARINGRRRDVAVRLWYSNTDPFAVGLDIEDETTEDRAEWVFAVELLEQGRRSVAGGGLVQVHPERTTGGRKIVVVSLRGDGGAMQLALAATMVDLFLDQCRHHSGGEDHEAHVAGLVDQELNQLLGGGPRT